MGDQMHLVLTKARDVEPGDLVWWHDDLYRCFEVDHQQLTGQVHIHLEACRHGVLHLPETAHVPVERLS